MPELQANGVTLHYDVHGDESAPAILLIAGYTMQMTRWSEAMVDGLVSAGYRVIRYDNRDAGLSTQLDEAGLPNIQDIIQALPSGNAAEKVPYTLDDMADDAAALLDALDATPAIVLGASMGGMIAQLLALRHPEKVRALIPVMTTSGDPALPRATPEAQEALTKRPADMSRASVVASSLESRRVIGSELPYRSSDEEIMERSGADFDRAFRPMGSVRQYAAIVAQPRWHERLAEISVPTLVLHGAIDPLIPAACGEDIAARVPRARFTSIPHWGHDFPSAITPVLLEHVTGFCGELRRT